MSPAGAYSEVLRVARAASIGVSPLMMWRPVDRVAQEEAIVEDDGDVRAGDAAAVEAGAELDPAGR
jgi:hypothetical protein